MRLEGSSLLYAGPPPLEGLPSPVQMLDRDTCETCCQCQANSFDQGLLCEKREYYRSRYLRAHGWHKPNKSKNWYCTMCVLVNNWLDDDKQKVIEASMEWLCGQACQDHALAHRLHVRQQPRPTPAAASSSSSTAAAPAAAQAAWSQAQRDNNIAEALQHLGQDVSEVQLLCAKPSIHMPHVPLQYMCPVNAEDLQRINPQGLLVMRRRTPDIVQRVHRTPPISAIRRAADDLRGIITNADGPYHRRLIFYDLPDDHAHWSERLHAIPTREQVAFVRPADPLAEAPTDAVEDPAIYRVCTTSASFRASSLTGEAPRGNLQLSVATWNAGAFRGFRNSEAFRGGKFHVLLGQEFGNEEDERRNPENCAAQRRALERMGWSVCREGYCLMAANATSVAETHLLFSESTRDYEAAFAEFRFVVPHSGLTQLKVGTLHVDHDRAKKPVAVAESLADWALKARDNAQVDIVGCDWNSALPSLTKVLERFGGGLVIHVGPDDCCGFIVPSWSKLLEDMPPPRATYFPVPVTDLGWGRRDADNH